MKIRVPRPEFPNSSSAETPMSCEQGRKTAENDSGRNSPRVVLPQFPFPSAAVADGGGRGGGPRIGEPPPAGEFRPQTSNRRSRPSEGASLRSSAPSVVGHSPRSANSPMRGPDGLRFSIGRRSLGSAPIENPRPSSDSGRLPASLGGVERPEGRAPSERRAELGGGLGDANNRP